MGTHVAISPSDGAMLLITVHAMVGGSVQENVTVSQIVFPVDLTEPEQALFLANAAGNAPQSEVDAALATLEAMQHPGFLTELAANTGVGSVTSLSVDPLPIAVPSGSSLVLGTLTPQTLTTTAGAALGDTSLAVTAFTPVQDWPVDTAITSKKVFDDAAVLQAEADVAAAATALAAAEAAAAAYVPPAVVKARAVKAAADAELAAAQAAEATDAPTPTPVPTPVPVPPIPDPTVKAAAIAAATARVRAADTALTTAQAAVPLDQATLAAAQTEKVAADQALVDANALV